MTTQSQTVDPCGSLSSEEISDLIDKMEWYVLEDFLGKGVLAYKGKCKLGPYKAVCWSGTPRVS